MNTSELLRYMTKAVTYDLGKEFFPGMTHNRAHPTFVFSLISSHAESAREGSQSSASCFFILGGHTGTHIDALGHYAEHGHVFGHPDQSIFDLEGYTTGLSVGGVERTPPVLRRGVLLDIPRLHGCEVLPANHEISPKDLEGALHRQKVTMNSGDVLLIRTGWMRHWEDQIKYCGIMPGVSHEGAQWIANRKVAFTGTDTNSFEKIDRTKKQVHVVLLARYGIQIMECLYLEDLARDARWEFIFVALPLRIRGATGSPIRPIAISL